MYRFCLPSLLLLALAAPLFAQLPDSGVVYVLVDEPMGPVGGALVSSEGRSATTDAEGRARLALPAGRRTLTVARVGYVPKRVVVTVPPGGEVSVTVELTMEDMQAMEMEAITVSLTRTERLLEDNPIRVEMLDEMEVDENTLMAPSGITMLLNETPGLRVQPASPSLGTGSVRILGLPGQYTALLADGLPLYGGANSALGPLDISPVDLQRVEIIKGAASALYGGQALGGVINLLSKPPTGKKELLLNRRSLGVTDAAAWLSRRLGRETGASLLASGNIQDAADVDGDGWGDQPRARRWSIRPRFTVADSAGRTLFVTAGYGYDDRDGGTLGNAVAPDNQPFDERLTSRRADLGVSARFTREANTMALRFALATTGRDRIFGAGPVETDRTTTGFLEVTASRTRARGATVVGATVQVDHYGNELNPGYDHEWVTPGLFATAERDIGKLTLSASLRGDFHPEADFQLTGRLALLARPAEGWSARLSAGTGFAPPAALNEETEAIGLRLVRPGAVLATESSVGLAADINGTLGAVEFVVTGHGSFIDDAIQLAHGNQVSHEGVLLNAAGVTRVGGVEVAGVWRFSRLGKLLFTYGFARGSWTDPNTGQRGPMPMLPEHRLGADLMFERPGNYRIGLEAIWYGRQTLHDDPYRTRSEPYLYTMFLAMKQLGPVEVVANFENLLDVRQTEFSPLVRPAQTIGGRWTTDGWAPLEGFLANVAVRYRW